MGEWVPGPRVPPQDLSSALQSRPVPLPPRSRRARPRPAWRSIPAARPACRGNRGGGSGAQAARGRPDAGADPSTGRARGDGPSASRRPVRSAAAGLSSLEGGIDYHFEVRPESGEPFRLDDPYRFGRSVSDYDLHLFGEGTLLGVHDRLGAHPTSIGGTSGVHFAVWAPNAQRASVVGDFNDWDGRVHPMRRLVPSGIWEVFIPGLGDGERYKFEIRTHGRPPAAQGGSVRALLRDSAALGGDRLPHRRLHLGRRRVDGGTRRAAPAREAPDGDLRGAPRVVANRARRRKPPTHVSRAGRHAGAIREAPRASRTSSCCR